MMHSSCHMFHTPLLTVGVEVKVGLVWKGKERQIVYAFTRNLTKLTFKLEVVTN